MIRSEFDVVTIAVDVVAGYGGYSLGRMREMRRFLRVMVVVGDYDCWGLIELLWVGRSSFRLLRLLGCWTVVEQADRGQDR